jgi:hypothetical protein
MHKNTVSNSVIMFRAVFWVVLPCKLIVDRRFRGTCNPEDSSEHHTRRRENLKSQIEHLLQPRTNKATNVYNNRGTYQLNCLDIQAMRNNKPDTGYSKHILDMDR